MLLPMAFFVIMTVLPQNSSIVPDNIPELNFTVPDLSFIWEQSQKHRLCYDNNLFVRCNCDFPGQDEDVDVMPQYALAGLVYPIESLFQTAHGSSSYLALCKTLAFNASNPLDCDAVNAAVDFCPRFFSYFEAFESLGCTPVSNNGYISSITEGEVRINDVIDNNSSGIAIPADQYATDCQLLYLGIVPLRAETIQNGGDNFESDEEKIAYQFYVNLRTNIFGIENQTLTFNSDSDLDTYIAQEGYGFNFNIPALGGAIVFNQVLNDTWDYTLRLNHSREMAGTNPDYNGAGYYEMNIPPTGKQVDLQIKSETDTSQGPNGRQMFPGTEQYYLSGALSLQQYVDTFILNSSDTVTTVLLSNGVANFPTQSFTTDGFWSSIGALFSVIFSLVLLFPVSNIIKQLVLDKEYRLKEGMMQMGLYPSAYWCTWMFHFFFQFFVLVVFLTIIGWIQIFKYSNQFYIFLFLLTFFTATIMMCMFISAFFSKARTASTLGVMAFFVSLFPFFAVTNTTPTSALVGMCILPASCLAIGTLPLATYEDAGIGINSDNLFDLEQDNISLGHCIVMMAFDTVFYGILAWYVVQVLPTEWGTHRPWYFCVTPRFGGFGSCGSKVDDVQNSENILFEVEVEGSDGTQGTALVEKVPPNLLRQVTSDTCISIRDLRKMYSTNRSTVYAVGADETGHGLNITMFRGQITALLGHNGAGKTTIMNMLSGMTTITSGNAYISGKSVRTDIQEIRNDLGVCPQHDILYNDATVLEHLKLFAVVKGVPSKDVEAEAESMLSAVGLTEKRNEYSKTLSGGQKRKLSVAMAFIGGSTTIFLDEPTSGMDPHSRRFTWDVISRMKHGRIIVLTTHFMDEADLLGDRIAIMSQGQLVCCGSSLFLKKAYGVGYSLTLVKETSHGTDTSKHSEEVITLLKAHVPDTKVVTDVGQEISVQLPQTASPQFPALLTELDANLESLHLTSYGVSVTTLEEVFLKVAEGTASHQDKVALNIAKQKSFRNLSTEGNKTKETSTNTKGYNGIAAESLLPHTREPDISTHIQALLRKRLLSFKRERKMQCFIFFAPVLFILLGLIILQFVVESAQPSLTLDPNAAYNTKVNPSDTRNPFFYNEMCADDSATCSVGIATNGLITQGLGPSTPVDSSSTLGLNNELFAHSTQQHSAPFVYGSFAWDVVDFAGPSFSPIAATNISGIHAAPMFLNTLTTSWLQALSSSDDSKVTTTIHPLPLTNNEKDLASSFASIFAFIFISIAFSFIPAAWVGFVVREREQKSKHLQVITGVSRNGYWISTYAWDILSFAPTFAFTILLLCVFKLDSLVNNGAIFAFAILLILWVFADAGFTYTLSFFFESHGTAMTVTLLIHWVVGLVLPFVTYFFIFFSSTEAAGKGLKWILRIFPSYAMGDAVLNIATRDVLSYVLGGSVQTGIWSFNISTAGMVYLAVFAVIYGVLVFVLERKLQGTHTVFTYMSEQRINRKLRNVETTSNLWDSDLIGDDQGNPPVVLDDDVIAERKRIEGGVDRGPDDVIEIDGLRKAFPISDGGLKVAVRGLWLRVAKGDCFGFLGTNGAGKTTTIAMMVGEQEPTLGVARLDGNDVVKYPEVVHRLVGFTPQFDAVFDTLTGREHLFLYGRIKGLSPDFLASDVEKVLEQVGLEQYSDRLAGGYSGGNKRKLSIGIALLGSPPIILLDEPTTGVDPVARHFVWNIISNIVTERKEAALILTTHLMEECEALSNRIGIMVGGRLRCLGSSQHLKDKYGKGFQLEISLSAPNSDEERRETVHIASHGDKSPSSDEICSLDELYAIVNDKAPEFISACVEPGGPASVLKSVGRISMTDLAAWILQEEKSFKAVSSLQSMFPGTELKERHGQRLRLNIPHWPNLSLAKLFSMLEEIKDQLGINEYMLGQTTLENIFNSLAATQREEKDPAPGMTNLMVRSFLYTNALLLNSLKFYIYIYIYIYCCLSTMTHIIPLWVCISVCLLEMLYLSEHVTLATQLTVTLYISSTHHLTLF